jgi:L-fucose isomerase-like protein
MAAEDVPALSGGLSLHQALKHIARDRNIDAFAMECWSGLPRALGLNPCLGFTEDAYVLACEGDVMACTALLLVRYLTGASAYVGDLYSLDLAGRLMLIHCGGPAALAADPRSTVLGRSALGLERGFETVTCRPRLPPGPVTLLRFYGGNCDHMHVAAGTLLDCQQSPNLGVNVQLSGDRWDFLDQCLGNHYLVVPGDVRLELALWCRWQGVELHAT